MITEISMEITLSEFLISVKRQPETIACGLLDSSLENDLGRYSILGAFLYLTMESRAGQLFENGEARGEDFLEYLGAFLDAHRTENKTDLPMTDGCIAAFSYDFGRKREKINTRHMAQTALPEARADFYDLYLIRDHAAGKTYLCTGERLHSCSWYEAWVGKMQRIAANRPPEGLSVRESVREQDPLEAYCCDREYRHRIASDFDRSDYQQAIGDMMEYMKAGDIYVANMTRQICVSSETDPLKMFEILRKRNPSPFGAYLDYGDAQVICASPERFLLLQNDLVKTRPIKGTRRRGVNPEEDAMLKQELADSSKDQSELLMIVDLERNDLNRVCSPGSVVVPEMFSIETYATVFHLVSEVQGHLQEGKNAADLLNAAFPGGSITGTPKIRAMEIIDELEHSARGLYTGSTGYISFHGGMDLNIVIRTAVHANGSYYIGVGGGITAESDTVFEFEETNQKAAALLAAIWEAEQEGKRYVEENNSETACAKVKYPESGGKWSKESGMSLRCQWDEEPDEGFYFGMGVFETMRIDRESVPLLERHLIRFSDSAAALGLLAPDEAESFQILAAEKIRVYLQARKLRGTETDRRFLENGILKAAWSDGKLRLSARLNSYTPEQYQKGFHLELSRVVRNETSPFTRHKTLNCGDLIWEKRRAHSAGVDEPVFVNTKGLLTEGAVTNLFVVKNGEIRPPPGGRRPAAGNHKTGTAGAGAGDSRSFPDAGRSCVCRRSVCNEFGSWNHAGLPL